MKQRARDRARALMVGVAVIGCLLVVFTTASVAAPPGAQPLVEKNIPNTTCGANAYEPDISGGVVQGSGLITCSKTSSLQIESCIQSSNNISSGFRTIQSSCQLVPSGGGTERTTELGSSPATTDSAGVYYRTYTFGYANGYVANVTSYARRG